MDRERISSDGESRQPAHILTACGPYCRRADLNFRPLRQVLEYALAKKPQLLILMGPFVDANNELVQRGDVVDTTGEEVDSFDLQEALLIPLLEDFALKFRGEIALDAPGPEIVIVPSPDEALCALPTPQPPYPAKFLSPEWERLGRNNFAERPPPCEENNGRGKFFQENEG